MGSSDLNRTPAIDLTARRKLAEGERVLAWSERPLVELVLDEQDRLVDIPRPDLVKQRRSWRERIARWWRSP